MGYTHYWTFNRDLIAPETLVNGFYRASQNVKACRKYLPSWIKIRGALGHGNSRIDERELWFNGDKATGASCDGFWIHRDDVLGNQGRGYCKTRKRPYDILVICSLLALEREFPGAFSWGSDEEYEGENPDVQAAREHFERSVQRQFKYALT